MFDTAWDQWGVVAVELGVGDSRNPTKVGTWGTSHWGDPTDALWSGLEPLWVDITCDVRRVRIGRGVDYTTNRFPTSTCQVVADNASGWATAAGGSLLDVRPGRALRVLGRATDSGVLSPLWQGYIDDLSPLYDPEARPVVVLNSVDALSVLAAQDGLEVPPVGAGGLSGARITRRLVLVGWPATWRDIAAGQVAMQATNLARNLADEAGVTADSEGGAVFATRDGLIAFRDRDWWRTASPAVSWTIGTVPEADACPTRLDVTYSADDVVSIVDLANSGGTVHRYMDGAAYSRYGPATFRRFDLICQDESQLDVLGGRILAVRGVSGRRVRGCDLSLLGDTKHPAAMFAALDYGQRVRLAAQLQDDTSIDQVMLVTQADMDITPQDWTVRIGLENAAPYTPVKAWGSARWGIDTWSSAA
jgi:hypothetical protein